MIEIARSLKTFYGYHDLLWMWTLRDIKVRYKQSFLGAAWAILQPLVLMVAFTVVFSYFNRLPTDGIPYPLFSYTALLPWTLLSTSINFAVPSLVTNMNLVTKIHFPREILPISAVVASFVDFIIASSVYLVLAFYYRLPIHPTLLWLPVLLLIQMVLILGIVLPATALNVWFRDIRFVIPLGVQLWMYASPIIYTVSSVPERLRPFYMLNPMATLIDGYRRVIIEGKPPQLPYLAISAIIAVTLLIGGYLYFKRAESQFADVI